MGAEDDYYRKYTDKPGRKPSLHSRLQNGKLKVWIDYKNLNFFVKKCPKFL
jgi:hypothetical protein